MNDNDEIEAKELPAQLGQIRDELNAAIRIGDYSAANSEAMTERTMATFRAGFVAMLKSKNPPNLDRMDARAKRSLSPEVYVSWRDKVFSLWLEAEREAKETP